MKKRIRLEKLTAEALEKGEPVSPQQLLLLPATSPVILPCTGNGDVVEINTLHVNQWTTRTILAFAFIGLP